MDNVSLALNPQQVGVLLREAKPDEEPFILQSWVRSYDQLMPASAKTHGMSRVDWIHNVARCCLARDGAAVVVTGEPEVVLGWVCGRSDHAKANTVHYVYVKKDARKMGIATQLLEALLGRHPSEVRGVRMTARPATNQRFKVAHLGWQYKPLAPEEL